MNQRKKTRREFIKKAVLSSAVLASAPNLIKASKKTDIKLTRNDAYDSFNFNSPNDNIQIALIGAGGMGVQDILTALQIATFMTVDWMMLSRDGEMTYL